MRIIFLFIGLILTFFLGFFFILLVAPKLKRLEQAALGWVIGLGFVTQELFLLSILNINYSIFAVLGLLLIGVVALGILVCQRFDFKIHLKPSLRYWFSWARYWFEELSLLDQILLIMLAILVFGAFIKAIFWPVYYWDALALYDYRAKIFFEAGGIAKSLALSSIHLNIAPPMTSLAHTFVYILGGKDANPQFIYPLFYLVLLITFYVSLRKYCQRWASLLFTFFLASIPFFVEFAANAYTNLPYAFYFGMGTVYLYRFSRERDRGLLIISGVLLGLAGWTRSPTEQFFLANLAVLILYCLWERKYYWAPLLLTFIFVILAFIWRIYLVYGLQLPSIHQEVIQAFGVVAIIDLERFLTVIRLLTRSIKSVSGTSIVLAFLVSLFFPRTAKKNIFLFLLFFSNFSIFVLGSYAFSLSWVDWKDSILNSANRLSMFLPPFVLYYVAVSAPGFLKGKEKK